MDKFVSSFARGHKKQKILETKVQKHIKQPSGQQMYLDLGQKLFGRNKECASCGMFYVIGDVDDERRHNQNCAKARDGPILSSTKGHRILSQNLVSKNGKRAMVLEVKSQLQYASESIRNILTVVSNELGSSSDYMSEGKNCIYLYVLEGTKTVIGCLVAEEIQSQNLVILSSTITATDVSICTQEDDDREGFRCEDPRGAESSISRKENDPSCINSNSIEKITIASHSHSLLAKETKDIRNECLEKRPFKTTLGVKQIWVHEKYRRSNVARSLVDIARQHFIFGNIVLRSHVAFSQPTSDGLKFALSYSQNNTIWGYS